MEGDFPHDSSPSQLSPSDDDSNGVSFNDGNGTEPLVVPTQEDVLESEDEGADEDEDDSTLKPVELEMKKKAGWVWIPVAQLRKMSKEELRACHRNFKRMQLTPGQEEVLKWQVKRVKDREGGKVKRERDREARKKCEEYEKEMKRLRTEIERLCAEVETLKALLTFNSEL